MNLNLRFDLSDFIYLTIGGWSNVLPACYKISDMEALAEKYVQPKIWKFCEDSMNGDYDKAYGDCYILFLMISWSFFKCSYCGFGYGYNKREKHQNTYWNYEN